MLTGCLPFVMHFPIIANTTQKNIILLAALALCASAALLPLHAEAAVAFGDVTSLGFHCPSETNCTNATGVVSPLTAPTITGSNTVLLIALSLNGVTRPLPDSITYDGVNLGAPTFDGGDVNFSRTLVWVVTNPASAKNIVVEMGDFLLNGVVVAAYYTGVNQATPYRTATTGNASGATDPATLSVTNSQSGDTIAGFFATNDTSDADGFTSGRVGANQTFRLQEFNISDESQLALSDEPGAGGTVTHSWDYVPPNNDSGWSAVAIPLISSRRALSKPPNNLGLVGYWSFNEGTSTKATDFSGNGNTGTLTTTGSVLPTGVNGKRGKALNFDGSTNYISLASSPVSNLAGPSSACMWAKNTNVSSNGSGAVAQTAFSFTDGSGNTARFGENNFGNTGIADGMIYVALTGGQWEAPSQQLFNNVWTFICYTFDGSTGKLYTNGQSISVQTGAYALTSGNVIGARETNANGTWWGGIDDLRIYSRALSATEVTKLYQSGAVKFTTSSVDLQKGSTLANGLVGHWTFDGPDVTTTIADRSGSNNNGYFVGGATSSAKTIGKLGQAFALDSTDDYVTVAHSSSLNITGTLSASFWIKKSSWSGTDGIIGKCSDSNCNNPSWFIESNDDRVFISLGSTEVTTDANFLPNRWYHVTITYNDAADEIFFYVDGAVSPDDNGASAASLPAVPGAPVIIGESYDGEPCDCTLDDVRLYNRTLTPTEVKQLYNLGAAKITTH